MQDLVGRVGKRKERKKQQKYRDDGVEERAAIKALGGVAVGEQEQEAAWEHGIHGEKGDDLGAAPFGGDDERVLDAVEDGVVERHGEKQQAHRDESTPEAVEFGDKRLELAGGGAEAAL